ncbi:MAG: hypothetical protein O9345_16045 [Burkholderiaceae bacterium]|nr:hypothetical protein [Burkholderiales bacterium]MCZ8339637.1 hypothetical protein [Burkholderiaceae bacterium]
MGTYIGFAKGENDSSATTLTTDTTLNVQVGDVLVGAAMFELGTDTTFSFSDTAGSTLTLGTKRTHSGNNLIAQPFILAVTSANTANTVTFTLGAARQYRSLVVGQYRGLAASIVDEEFLDVTSASPSTISTPNVTFGGAGILVGLFAPYSNNPFTVASPFTERYDAGTYRVGLFDRDIPSSGNYPATLTQTSTDALLFGVGLEDSSGGPIVPTLSAPGVQDITSTSARPKVTLTY